MVGALVLWSNAEVQTIESVSRSALPDLMGRALVNSRGIHHSATFIESFSNNTSFYL